MSKLLKLVQIGKRELQMDDEAYRNLLEEVSGQRSSRGLNDFKLSKVVDRMKTLGFIPRANPQNKSQSGQRRYRSREAPKILAIWITMHKQGFVRNGSDQALDAYVKRMTSQVNGGSGVAKLVWAKPEQAAYVLEALKEWHYRVMCDAIRAAGGRIPLNDKCTGSASYDKLAGFYENDFKGTKI